MKFLLKPKIEGEEATYDFDTEEEAIMFCEENDVDPDYWEIVKVED